MQHTASQAQNARSSTNLWLSRGSPKWSRNRKQRRKWKKWRPRSWPPRRHLRLRRRHYHRCRCRQSCRCTAKTVAIAWRRRTTSTVIPTVSSALNCRCRSTFRRRRSDRRRRPTFSADGTSRSGTRRRRRGYRQRRFPPTLSSAVTIPLKSYLKRTHLKTMAR